MTAVEFIEPLTHEEGVSQATKLFVDTYGAAPEGVWAAPGRVNLIGEHTDYNAGLCLPIALPHRTFIALKPREDTKVRVVSGVAPDKVAEADLDGLKARGVDGWSAYPTGVAWALRQAGFDKVKGFDAAFVSCVPLGSGLSSSAAMTCSTALALDDVYGLGYGDSDAGRVTLINAAINVQKKHPDWKMVPEIMIPLVGEVKELKYVKDVVVATADKIIKDAGIDMKYEVGTMIEIPRAALTADEIAKEAEFFSFGTNDLTQMTFGFSRDDAGKFLSYYYDKKIYESDPFAHLDQNGVGKLVAMAAKLGKETRPDIHLGICGEHGGDPTSVEFCHKVGLNYVSCSPYRVPIARLAAAQAAIKHPRAN
jgi:hypothetical protein